MVRPHWEKSFAALMELSGKLKTAIFRMFGADVGLGI